MNVIGPQVHSLREKQELTQEELAAKCNLLGWNISRSTLAKIESQVRRVTDEEVALLADALSVDINQLYEETQWLDST
ncbi:MAG: helix-turn-helix transcriptional regulator [Gammaproteobacteria bacterium]|nr:helix-turn-helix transcriptional regulator [Gammaproteobacteria bacterium]